MLLLMILLLAGTIIAFRTTSGRSTSSSQLRLPVNRCLGGNLMLVCPVVVWDHRVLVWACVALLARSLDPHWDLQVRAELMNCCSVHRSGS